MRYGTIAIIGRTNVGKSTFLNHVLGMPLAIVSRQPQTTRDALLGVVNSGDAQIAFVDTPGLHKPKNELGRRMNQEATDSLRSADAAIFMTDVYQLDADGKAAKKQGLMPKPRPGDRSDAELLELVPKELPTLLVVNKIDRIKDKTRLLPYLQRMNERHPFVGAIPISARSGDGTDRVLAEVVKLLPEAEKSFPADEVTDRPVSFFAREYIREQVLLGADREVPHAVAVTLDSIVERNTGLHIAATIHVEKVGQRSILVGRGGEKIKEIGTAARQRLSELTEQPVHLTLFVRVTERWRNMPRQLAELGYTNTGS
jgi:GTP-binding protein Era